MSYRDSNWRRSGDDRKRGREDKDEYGREPRRDSRWTDKEWAEWERTNGKDSKRGDRAPERKEESVRRPERRGDSRRGDSRRGDTRRDEGRRDDSRRQSRREEPRDDARRHRRSSPSIDRPRRRDRSVSKDRRRRDRSASVDRRRRDRSGPRTQAVVGGVIRNLRIDRHECRKAAIEFLINNYDVTDKYSNSGLEDMIVDHIRSLEMDFEYYAFTQEILKGLLVDRKYTVIADRWIMGILDEHLQAELRVPDLSILRVAAFELLTHPEIPTTVVINEVNVLAKMYCPERQSLIHAAVNRMIETQISIGNELAIESGEGRKSKRDDPLSLLVGLDQEAQLALILLEQMRKKRKSERRRRSSSRSSSYSSRSPSPKRSRPQSPMRTAAPVSSQPEMEDDSSSAFLSGAIRKAGQGITIKFAAGAAEAAPAATGKPAKVNASTQTVKDPTIEPGVRIYRITM